MPKFQVAIPHGLNSQDATDRLERFVDSLRADHKDRVSDLEQRWENNRLHFGFKSYGLPIKGTVTVSNKLLQVDGDLPFSAIMFKGKIEASIREQLERLMN
jgi:hypothetical protein